MSNLNNNIINERMERFDKYLEYSGMDRKQYQYDGVKWCLQNELQPPNIYQLQKQAELEAREKDPEKKIKKITVKYEEEAYIRGGFLVDEMGLGKTITMIGLMLCNYVKRTLIVLPPILIDQWINQIYRTTGHIPLLYHGTNKKKNYS